jgi:error-prone DNA polymerase
MSYVELQVTSNFSFLRGASHPGELVEQAAALGYAAVAITDRNTVAGIVRAHAAAKKHGGIRLIVGCRVDLLDGPGLLVYPANKAAYARLCQLLTTGNLRTEKGKCELYIKDVIGQLQDCKIILLPPQLSDDLYFDNAFIKAVRTYKMAFGDNLYVAASRYYNGDDQKYLYQLARMSAQEGIPLVATNDVHYHIPQRRELQDVMTCIREKCTIHTAGFLLHANAERYVKCPAEMHRLFRQYPDAIRRTAEIAEACTFSLDELSYRYPSELTNAGRTPDQELAYLAWKGAREFYGEPLPEKVRRAIEHELAFIEQMNYAHYFLTVYDIVQFARSRGILCQGRGSAANSTVCFCLGITSVNPEKFDLLFERFVSAARNEPPDIDVDFEHERREEVIQYIYRKYGRDRAAIVATVTQQHQKGAVRDVAKAMGLSLDAINRLSGSIWEFTDEWFDNGRISSEGFDPADAHLKKVLQLTREFMGFPRQLGQHTGGFVITDSKITELCPVLNARMENRTCIEWNKDDIDALGFMKVDVLALGMLTCIRKAFDLARQHYGLELTLANIPQDDSAVYEMISHADTIGVFQIESRAQQAMLPRMKPKCFYDLVIEVALVRPGPIQGDMVHPYLRRRNGEEAVTFPSKELEQILGRTLGVPLFQEQAMKIAIVAAGFTPTEADALRRSIATFKLQGLVTQFKEKLIRGMTGRGYTQEYAERIFGQLEGFGSYGFPESHAASFALLVYVSSWIKCYYPDVFACALLNSQPMGFYQPAQIVADARKHGVAVRPADVNASGWDHTLEEKSGKYFALRLGFRIIKGIRQEEIAKLLSARVRPFATLDDVRNTGIGNATLEKLADADCFRSLKYDRRAALWEVSTKDKPEALFAGQLAPDAIGEHVSLTVMQESEHVVQDYATTSLSLRRHPVGFVRDKLAQFDIIPAADLANLPDGSYIKVAGLVLVRQRPGTAGGVLFMTIEDETGVANLVIFETLFEQYRKAILQSRLIMVQGKLQKQGDVIHVIVMACYDYSKLLRKLLPGSQTSAEQSSSMQLCLPLGKNKPSQVRQRGDEISFPGARDFR